MSPLENLFNLSKELVDYFMPVHNYNTIFICLWAFEPHQTLLKIFMLNDRDLPLLWFFDFPQSIVALCLDSNLFNLSKYLFGLLYTRDNLFLKFCINPSYRWAPNFWKGKFFLIVGKTKQNNNKKLSFLRLNLPWPCPSLPGITLERLSNSAVWLNQAFRFAN
jgi:hypothetical protein